MSIVVRRRPVRNPTLVTTTDLLPRVLRDMLRWDPFRGMAPSWITPEPATFSPAFEVEETQDRLLFKAELPGVQDKDVEVRLRGNRLTISGKRELERAVEHDAYYTYERSSRTFMRAFTLPAGIDGAHAQAALEQGVLTVVVPKVVHLDG